ncbi:clavaminate synthase protein [Salix suchowensis]|nr:clavaminate synthase protein [Salix suchowensis]KAG5226850.1 clavaminate synthase protein [Salix suchowensis]
MNDQQQCKYDGETMPLVLHPPEPNKSDTYSQNSVVLLRGFDVKNAKDFNDIIEAFGWDDIHYIRPACGHTFTNTYGLPMREFIYDNHEMVLVKGGQTPFVPSFRVTERMLEEFPEAVEEVEAKRLKYTFTTLSKDDTSSMRGRGWEDAFGTSDKAEAGRRARALGMEMEWLPGGGVKTILGPGSLTEVFGGRKGRRMWFNTVVDMHGKETSSAMLADGTEIPETFVKRCEQIIEEESIQFKWEKGDVLFLDNMALLHGRRPSLPPRKVLVATCK